MILLYGMLVASVIFTGSIIYFLGPWYEAKHFKNED